MADGPIQARGLSSWRKAHGGDVYDGLVADRDAMSDVDTLAALIEKSLEELVSTVPGS